MKENLLLCDINGCEQPAEIFAAPEPEGKAADSEINKRRVCRGHAPAGFESKRYLAPNVNGTMVIFNSGADSAF